MGTYIIGGTSVKIRRLVSTFIITSFILFFYSAMNVQATSDHLTLHSETAILMEAKSGQILFEKEMNQPMYPASITKIITGIIAIEKGNLDDIVTVSENARKVVGTRVYLLEDEKVDLKKLVQGLLINSGNDAGTAIAEHLAGNEKNFATVMNEFVKKEIGVHNTNFENPHGLFSEEHITTAYDMAKITQYAMNNELFRDIVGTKEMEWIGEGWETTIHNHHRLLWDYEGATGVKNGYVSQSGFTLVTTALRDGTEYIVVTLNAPTARLAYSDTIALLDYGFEHFQTNKLPKDRLFTSNNGAEFELENDFYYVSRNDDEVLIEVSNAGRVSIKNEANQLIASKVLKKVGDKYKMALEESEAIQNEKNVESEEPNLVRWLIQVLSIFGKND